MTTASAPAPASTSAAQSAAAIIATYVDELRDALQVTLGQELDRTDELFRDARTRGATFFFCGNGGAAATASHFACDLGKNTVHPVLGRFRTIALVDNIPAVTAWGNDNGYDQIFVEQARNLMRPGDLLVAISGSGNSPNVLLAADYARSIGCTVIGLIGFQGGALKQKCDVALVVPGRTIEQAEDGQLILNHAICTAIRTMDGAA